jgi:tetratricopeptide (TPR) repeat protein
MEGAVTARHRARAKQLFHAALEVAPARRAEFVENEAGGDAALAAEVLSLLAHDNESFLPTPAAALIAAALSTPMRGRQVGHYRIVGEIDVGGMGEVYAAVEEGTGRTVALKLIRRDLDSAEALARFDQERQALAKMNHPNIAQVYGGGVTDGRRPYFAMELVPGRPIVDYCDQERLGLPERLELFMQVCAGIQHAHQKAIIHRDLKPSNVLVTLQDGRAVPKIIDFGIAKTVGRPSLTRLDQRPGTPDYMSPEQRQGQDLDIRTDVYSLGLLLYELLLGVLPPAESGEPPRPGEHLRRLGDRAAEIAANRRTDAADLARQLHGDLHWIVVKALEEDRDRRYSSASDLAAELDRHLRSEPVLASPPSSSYRLGKFLRRHRLGVAAGAIAILALATGAIGAGVGFVKARRAQVVATHEARHAGREAETARQVSAFLVDLFQISEPDEAKGNKVTAREILDTGLRRIAVELQGQPEVRATLMDTMGTVYQSLGLFDRAEALLREALALRRRTLGDAHPAVAASLFHLAESLRARAQYPEAEICYRRSLVLRERLLGPRHPDVAESLNGMGLLYYNRGQYPGAESCFQRALTVWQGARDPRVATALSHLALLYRDQGRQDLALSLFERAITAQERQLGPEHSDLLGNLNNLADIYRSTGRYARAEQLLKRVLAVNERIMGPDHPLVSTSLNNLAMVYRAEGRNSEAEKLYLRCLAIDEKARGPDHPDVATSLNNLAVVYREEGRYGLAEPLFLRSLAIREKALPADHPHIAGSMNQLGLLFSAEGRYSEAEALFKQSLASREKVLGPTHPHVAVTLTNLANLYLARGDDLQAEPLFRRALSIWGKLSQPSQPDLASTLESYARLLRRTHRAGDAATLENRAREIRQSLAELNNA